MTRRSRAGIPVTRDAGVMRSSIDGRSPLRELTHSSRRRRKRRRLLVMSIAGSIAAGCVHAFFPVLLEVLAGLLRGWLMTIVGLTTGVAASSLELAELLTGMAGST